MIEQKVLETIEEIVGKSHCRFDEPMRNHTTFKIGGNADVFLTPDSVQSIVSVIELLKKSDIPYFVMGNGSNILVSDDGFRGVVIQLGEDYSGYKLLSENDDETTFELLAGTKLSTFGNEMARLGYAGFEFATGIPGNIGGAIRMNAGAYGGEMKDIVESASVIDEEGNIKSISLEELELGYRTSSIAKNNWIVLSVVLKLKKGDSEAISEKIKELALSRRSKQPLEYPSAGSTFKRPVGFFAAKLIEDAGLKGLTVGGAQVSEKHAGFVVNVSNATASDIIQLTDMVKETVLDKFGVALELEIVKVGF